MTAIHAGASLERFPGPKYLGALRFAELTLRSPLPRTGTLEGWRASGPDDLVLSLVAPREAVASRRGPLRIDEDLEAGMGWLLDAARVLRARFVVVPTRSDTTTGQRDRDLLASYFDELRRDDGPRPVWAPGGLWEPEEAIRFSRKLGVACAWDPLHPDQVPPPDDPLYVRLGAIGGRQRFTEGMLTEVVEAVEATGAREAWVAIESERSFREATRLARLTGAVEAEAEAQTEA